MSWAYASSPISTDTVSSAYKREFIDFMIEADVLSFGDFVTKSGRPTPYFVNTGRYRTGAQIRRLGGFYADAITARLGADFDVLFGPAYKGIPLAVETAAALAERGHDVGFCFDRKEVKDHGEGGRLVGHQPIDGDRILIIEDVTTAGTSVRETVPVLRAAADIELAGLVVAVDRMERSGGDTGVPGASAMQQLGEEFDMATFAIVTVRDIIELADLADADLARMNDHLDAFGAVS